MRNLRNEETPKDWNQVPTENTRDPKSNQENPSFPRMETQPSLPQSSALRIVCFNYGIFLLRLSCPWFTIACCESLVRDK